MSEGILDLGALLMGGGITAVGDATDPYTPLTYPLDFSGIGIVGMEWGVDQVRGVSESPFTLHRIAVRHWGERWRATISVSEMTREKADRLISFLLNLDGGYGAFLLGDVFNASPRGVATGSPIIYGANQTGKQLNTAGWTPSTTGILKAGDKIQIGSFLHMITRDANSTASGNATLDIWPRLRFVPSDGLTIVTNEPKGLFRLSGPTSSLVKYDLRGSRRVTSFEAIEVF